MSIKKIAVIGSGVMGSGIAALAASAGVPVMLLDIVPEGAADRNQLAKGAIEKQLKTGGFTHPDFAKNVTPGNLEDDLGKLADVDWIIEAVLEKLEVKQKVYALINKTRKQASVVSSNTSTLPIHTLMEGMGEAFAQDFMIAHFFNPPRHMRLLEVAPSPQMPAATFEKICDFADRQLGKELVHVKDTPGFIANRIGVYWLTLAMNEAIKQGISVEDADALLSKPIGVPKTGVFGLYDLIGLDLMPLIAKSLTDTLQPSDTFFKLEPKPPLLAKLIESGHTGRKGKGGFYKIEKQGDKKIMQSLDLQSGNYHEQQKPALASGKSKNIAELLKAQDKGGAYARSVMLPFLHYTASLIPEISDTIANVDAAMRAGYSWKFGPFELMDQLGAADTARYFREAGLQVPDMVEKAQDKTFYNQTKQLSLDSSYIGIPKPEGVLLLSDIKRSQKPLLANGSASLWDLGDSVACLEITTKLNALDHDVFDIMEQAVEKIKANFKAMVIGSDAAYFSAGANLSKFLEQARAGEFDAISSLIKRGQQVMLSLKYAPFPVVSAASGVALGGGCELLLHSDAIQAHKEITAGLVETNVGVIPAWGGCKEMLLRVGGVSRPSEPSAREAASHASAIARSGNIQKIFEQILFPRTTPSADYLQEMHIGHNIRISMNRARLLSDAKSFASELAANYQPPKSVPISLPDTVKSELQAKLEGFEKEGKLSAHQQVIGQTLVKVLSCGNNIACTEANILALEHDGFMELICTQATQDRIEHMLNTGKPLKN